MKKKVHFRINGINMYLIIDQGKVIGSSPSLIKYVGLHVSIDSIRTGKQLHFIGTENLDEEIVRVENFFETETE